MAATIVISALLLAAMVFAVRYLVKNGTCAECAQKGDCAGVCSHCAGCTGEHKQGEN